MSSTKDLEKMTVAQLKDDLVKKGLSADGKKADLVKRLADFIQKAEEDAILNGSLSGDIPESDDLLGLGDNDDLGDLPPLDESKTVEHDTLAPVEPKSEASGDEKSEKPKISAPAEESKEDRMKRAQRLGLPIGTAELTSEDARKKRAERFGTAVGDSLEAKTKRALRFGTTNDSVPKTKPAAGAPIDEAAKERLIKRAQRFGVPVNADGKRLDTNGAGASPDVLAKRAARFGTGASSAVVDPEVEARKKARLERFADTL